MTKGLQGFQKGHSAFKGAEKGWFKKGKRNNPAGEFKKGHKTDWTDKMKKKAREDKLGEKNPNWKGEDVGYTGVHQWLYKKLGQPNYCEMCKKSNKKKYHWANKNHTYLRVVEDYMRLCANCHTKYDILYNNRPDNY